VQPPQPPPNHPHIQQESDIWAVSMPVGGCVEILRWVASLGCTVGWGVRDGTGLDRLAKALPSRPSGGGTATEERPCMQC
jgi:hypothetical protein